MGALHVDPAIWQLHQLGQSWWCDQLGHGLLEGLRVKGQALRAGAPT